MKPVGQHGQAQECILRRPLMFCSFGTDSHVRMKTVESYSTSHRVRTYHILSQVITVIFAASRRVPLMAYIAHVVTGVWCCEIFQPECWCNHLLQPISDWQFDIDAYFKSKFCVEDPATECRYWSEVTQESAHKKMFYRGWDFNPQPLDRQASVLSLDYYHSLMFDWYHSWSCWYEILLLYSLSMYMM